VAQSGNHSVRSSFACGRGMFVRRVKLKTNQTGIFIYVGVGGGEL
jgi:hypothetical protein